MRVSTCLTLAFCGCLPLMLAGCSFVKPASNSHTVALAANAGDVADCKYLGDAPVKTVQKVGFVSRGKDKVDTELVTLAKNEAAVMGGTMVLPKSAIVKGEQVFAVYNCKL